MDNEHVLKDTQATLSILFSGGDADGAVSVSAKNALGSEVAAGTATPDAGDGAYTWALPPQSDVGKLTVSWSGKWSGIDQTIRGRVEVVGAFLFTIAQLRAFGDQALKDETAYPAAVISDARARITDSFEQICGKSFVPRYSLDDLRGIKYQSHIWLKHLQPTKILSCLVDTKDLSSQLADLTFSATGKVLWKNGSFNGRTVRIGYEYGYDYPPSDISRAAMVLARYELVTADVSDRMIAFTSDLGTVRMSVPGRDYPTGIPLVDSTLNRYGAAVPDPA